MMIVYLQTDCIQNTPPLQIELDSKLVIQLSNQCAFYLAKIVLFRSFQTIQIKDNTFVSPVYKKKIFFLLKIHKIKEFLI